MKEVFKKGIKFSFVNLNNFVVKESFLVNEFLVFYGLIGQDYVCYRGNRVFMESELYFIFGVGDKFLRGYVIGERVVSK